MRVPDGRGGYFVPEKRTVRYATVFTVAYLAAPFLVLLFVAALSG